jgi:endonuclease/exonuclease/phosphatase family metal-dependent hydrolase
MRIRIISGIISLVLALILLSSCKDTFDFDDYETRIEYFNNIRANEYLNGSSLTVVTWNIRLAFGHTESDPWSDDIGGKPELIDSISQLLKSLNPDIVLLQEVPYNRENTIIKKVVDTMGYFMNFNYAFGGHGYNSNGTYPTRAQWGTAILSKFEIVKIENREVFNLNDIWSRRSVLNATLQVENNDYLNAYSLHYFAGAPSTESFLSQVYETREFYQESSFPIIIGGDFNYSNSIDTILNLTNCSPPNYDDIDKIYISEEFDILEYYHQNAKSLNFSDHFAGIVKIKLKE